MNLVLSIFCENIIKQPIKWNLYSFLTDLRKQRCLERANADRNRFIFFANLFPIGIIVFIGAFLLQTDIYAQRYNFNIYSVEHGLPQSQVLDICQDKRGNLWLGTYGGGVCKFDGKTFTQYNEKNGLCDNNVVSLLEDKEGNLWIGTDAGGVSKYDGKTFTHFNEKNGLSNNMVWSIFEDNKGNIWFGTYGGGATRLSPKESTQKKFKYFTVKDGLSNNIVWTIIQDKRNYIWLGTDNGLNRFNPDLENTPINPFTNYNLKEGLKDNRVLSLEESSNGDIWCGTMGGGVNILTMIDEIKLPKIINYTINEGLANNVVWSILEDSKGNFWCGTYGGGVSKFTIDIKHNYKFKITNFSEKEGLSNSKVFAIKEDNSGNLWFGTYGGGVVKLSGESFIYITESEGLLNNSVGSIMEDKKGNIWFGTYGGGATKYNPKKESNLKFSYLTDFDAVCPSGLNNCFNKLSSGHIWCMLEDKSGSLWFGTDNGGLTKYDGKNFNYFAKNEIGNNTVQCIIEDKNNNLWFGTAAAGVCRYDKKTFKIYNENTVLEKTMVTTMHEDKTGNIWISTFEKGICKFDGKNFIKYTQQDGLKSETIISISEDSSGNMYFGTYGGGINILPNNQINIFNSQLFNENEKIKKLKWKYITTDDGLTDDAILLMIFDEDNNLFAGTNKGINKITFDKHLKVVNIKQFGNLEGFKGIECNSNAVLKDSKGNIWFGTVNGAISYNPKEDLSNLIEPKTHITGLRLFFGEINWANISSKQSNDSIQSFTNEVTKKESSLENTSYSGIAQWSNLPLNLKLTYDKNHITFDFIGISLKIPEKVRYKFTLEGYEESWSTPVTYNHATYSKLPPGEYTFKVLACNEEGIWNKTPATYSFVITPPFWMTWWFYTLSVIFIVIIINTVYNLRMRTKIRQIRYVELIKQRTREKQVAQDALKAKTDFLANMSHEIRTPLNAVVGMTNILLGTKHEEKNLRYLQTIKKSSDLLLSVVNDVLELSKLEAGKMELKLKPVNLLLILENLLIAFSAQAKDNNNIINYEIDKAIPIIVIADENRLIQVINNLISNALKFTKGGKISLRLSLQHQKNNELFIKTEVIDTGIGISKNEQDKLFKKFSQIDAELTGNIKGSGLGLVISAKIVTLMNGKIGLESEKDKGSTFWFTFRTERSKLNKEIYSTKILLVQPQNTNGLNEIEKLFTKWHLPYNIINNEEKNEYPETLAESDLILVNDKALNPSLEQHLIKLTKLEKSPKLVLLTETPSNKKTVQPSYFQLAINSNDVNSVQLINLITDKKIDSEHIQKDQFIASLKFQPQILVAEDNATNQEIICLMLSSLNCKSDIACNGKEAIEMAKANTYDMIFMDIDMPVINGITATNEIKKILKDKTPPIVALTAYAMEEELNKFMSQGINDYLTKPITDNDLLIKLIKWIPLVKPHQKISDLQKIDKQVEKNNEFAQEINQLNDEIEQHLLNPIIVEQLSKLGNGDGSTYTKILLSYFKEYEKLNKNIIEGFEYKDYPKAQSGFHALGGSSALIGATLVADIARDLENLLKDSKIDEANLRFPYLQKAVEDLRKFVKKEYSLNI